MSEARSWLERIDAAVAQRLAQDQRLAASRKQQELALREALQAALNEQGKAVATHRR